MGHTSELDETPKDAGFSVSRIRWMIFPQSFSSFPRKIMSAFLGLLSLLSPQYIFGQSMGCFPILGDDHQSMFIGIYIALMFEIPWHGTDEHKPHTIFSPWHIWICLRIGYHLKGICHFQTAPYHTCSAHFLNSKYENQIYNHSKFVISHEIPSIYHIPSYVHLKRFTTIFLFIDGVIIP